ncbi:trans-aconitate 2-methyltransferase [Aurantimonas sp. VKM B-3413]|uniref:class I SAM-dependent methyltransferase n=1 Tax=Aurantimonas sp. VKM B-3413 TaxID=2779401 RepID=UPI001E4FAD93|nr:class I SAM-dependent methyltransferase [Aurantimonas sp. VKM B-3413]MCB8836626.1 class I SAM-dependent methyltransferase [Aurantimonas sp. VKM B-3413]
MSAFASTWLALREPADRAARDQALLSAAASHANSVANPLIVDLGCGTGSTLRTLSPLVPAASWRLVDNDPALLAEAKRRAANDAVETAEADLRDVAATPLAGARLVTASALFDLASREMVAALAERLAAEGTGFYAALSYDGTARWSKTHPLDIAVVAAFNRHQRGDKGLGPALGPGAGAELATAFGQRGFDVRSAESPWTLGPDDADLQAAFVEGMASAVSQTEMLEPEDVETWLAARLASVSTGRCVIGHLDILALPKG